MFCGFRNKMITIISTPKLDSFMNSGRTFLEQFMFASSHESDGETQWIFLESMYHKLHLHDIHLLECAQICQFAYSFYFAQR